MISGHRKCLEIEIETLIIMKNWDNRYEYKKTHIKDQLNIIADTRWFIKDLEDKLKFMER